MIHEHPLAYLLGVEGAALLRAFTGGHDRAFVGARLAEVRRLLDDPDLADAAVDVDRVDPVAGYRSWAATYDTAPNTAFADTPVVDAVLDTLPAGTALDAACGTGRHTAGLVARGHRTIGVDASPDMLDRARRRVPEADLRRGDLHRLPVADAAADLVVCALALTHVPDLAPVFAEFARVLRPGGHLVLSDVHPERVARGSAPAVRDGAGRPARLPAHPHRTGDYLRAALPLGLRPLRCEEPVPPPAAPAAPAAGPGPWDAWPWSLAALVPEAARAADHGVPAMLVWQFRLAGA